LPLSRPPQDSTTIYEIDLILIIAIVPPQFRFLLHYTARDEVALLDRGTGGVPEVRNAIDNYNETSPLYGFLHYRRRKVILRYMPEGLSRLILGTALASAPRDARMPVTNPWTLSC
jgi:hypothetical protein